MIRFTPQVFTIDAAASDSPDAPRRTITGIAAPYNIDAVVSSGERIRFAPGSLPTDGPAPKLFMYHDSTQPVGVVTERVDMGDAMAFTARLSDTEKGRDALTLAKDSVIDQVSVGVNPIEWTMDGETMVVTRAEWYELSMVPHGAFGANANIATVAASTGEGIHHDEEKVSNIENETPVDEELKMSEEVTAPATIEAAPIVYAQAKREFKMPSASEWISAQMQGGAIAAEMNAKVRAAAPDVVTSDLDGIMPLPIVSPIYNNFRGLRPVIDAVGVRQMPAAGKVFIRPVVTTHTSMASASENTTIQAGTFVVNDVQITKGIYGGYVEVSEASLDWSQPEVLGALLDDMARVYANTVDNVAADTLESGTTNTNNFASASITDPSAWITWIYQAASDILTDSNGNLPTHLFLAPNRWASLGNLSDDAGRPLFPNIGPMNALGQLPAGDYAGNAFGLQVVVDRNLPSGTLIIGDATSGGFECWEQMKGAISLNQPTTLSRQIAFRGYFAAKMIDSTKFIKAAFV